MGTHFRIFWALRLGATCPDTMAESCRLDLLAAMDVAEVDRNGVACRCVVGMVGVVDGVEEHFGLRHTPGW